MIFTSQEKTCLLQTQESEADPIERIQCTGILDCLNRAKESAAGRIHARETAAQGKVALRAEESRLRGVLQECQAEAQASIRWR